MSTRAIAQTLRSRILSRFKMALFLFNRVCLELSVLSGCEPMLNQNKILTSLITNSSAL